MILKGSQRKNGSDLAVHLMNSFDNEAVEIAQVHGAVAGDLLGAFAEFEAISQGTRCQEYLYSLSINPPAPLTREQYYESIQEIEAGLGLVGQPRAVVFHIKDGREHCHVVWSRINVEKMQAVQLSFDKSKLMDLACKLAEKYDLSLPPGLKAWQKKEAFRKEKLEPTLAENAQNKSSGLTPEQRREDLTSLYEHADNGKAFRSALEDKGYVLAAGDRRGFVIVDRHGDVHSLSRYIKGQSAKNIAKYLAPLTPADLPGADEARELALGRAQAEDDVKREQDKGLGDKLRAHASAQLSRNQAARRVELASKEQELLIRQASERMALHAAQESESRGVLFRMRSYVAELITSTPALRSVLGPMQKKLHLDPSVRHELERKALAGRHDRESQDIDREKRLLSKVEQRERQSLEIWVKRQMRTAQRAEIELKAEFAKAASRPKVARSKVGKNDSGTLAELFNSKAEAPRSEKKKGDEDARSKSWKARAGIKKKRERKKGRGYGYRRDKDKDLDRGR